ncbi:biotin/lipoyl-binding protein [Thiothrix nivea]|uniref:biotin/lipoyl-binding protein n=1 Tax=Thiothrix nivea TaxID=1031 RepID=UPI00030F4F8B|nr:biotin/lipoyl-binding protein [Thiothrix nivea]
MKLPSTLPASAVLGLMLLFLVGCQSDQQAAANGADVARPPAAVDVRTLVAKDIELKETSSGRVAAFREAEVRPQISGIIQKRLFEEGSTVKKGDVLYQVDPAPLPGSVGKCQGWAGGSPGRSEQYP